jgi:hypothetical protein
MTRNEMLKRLRLTSEEFKDLMQKLEKFHKSLNEPQRVVIERSLPGPAAAAATFGADVTVEQLQRLFATDATNTPVASGHVAVLAPNPED